MCSTFLVLEQLSTFAQHSIDIYEHVKAGRLETRFLASSRPHLFAQRQSSRHFTVIKRLMHQTVSEANATVVRRHKSRAAGLRSRGQPTRADAQMDRRADGEESGRLVIHARLSCNDDGGGGSEHTQQRPLSPSTAACLDPSAIIASRSNSKNNDCR